MNRSVSLLKTRRWPAVLLVALAVGLLLWATAGCGRGGGSRAAIGDAADMTVDALTDLLLGVPPERAATMVAPPDPPLLKPGVYETVYIAADAKAFSDISRNALSVNDMQDLEKRVVERVNERLKKKGFSAMQSPYPIGTVDREKALVVTLTPTTQEGGSPQEREENRGKTYVLIRLTVVDPATRAILAQRDYYSGQEVRGEGRQESRRLRLRR